MSSQVASTTKLAVLGFEDQHTGAFYYSYYGWVGSKGGHSSHSEPLKLDESVAVPKDGVGIFPWDSWSHFSLEKVDQSELKPVYLWVEMKVTLEEYLGLNGSSWSSNRLGDREVTFKGLVEDFTEPFNEAWNIFRSNNKRLNGFKWSLAETMEVIPLEAHHWTTIDKVFGHRTSDYRTDVSLYEVNEYWLPEFASLHDRFGVTFGDSGTVELDPHHVNELFNSRKEYFGTVDLGTISSWESIFGTPFIPFAQKLIKENYKLQDFFPDDCLQALSWDWLFYNWGDYHYREIKLPLTIDLLQEVLSTDNFDDLMFSMLPAMDPDEMKLLADPTYQPSTYTMEDEGWDGDWTTWEEEDDAQFEILETYYGEIAPYLTEQDYQGIKKQLAPRAQDILKSFRERTVYEDDED